MIKLNNVTLRKHNVFFNLTISKNQKVQIVGKSGAGKSTLLWLIAGLLRCDSGKIIINNQDVTNILPHKRDVAILFQDNNLFPHLNVLKNLLLGLEPNLKINEEKISKINEITKLLDINNLLQRSTDEISGGQKQRVALCRALLQNKSILLLDEPFSALDTNLRKDLLDVVKTISKDKTLLLVSHDEVTLNKTILIKNGKIAI